MKRNYIFSFLSNHKFANRYFVNLCPNNHKFRLMTRTIYRKPWFVPMDLSTASQWAEVIGLATILGAAIYSWFQTTN